jgi:FRG domain
LVLGLEVTSLQNYIHHIREHVSQWGRSAIPWFRGEPSCSTPLLPRVFRKMADGRAHNENQLLQMFRMKAPAFAQDATPPRENTDQWLFLAQHVGLPTRLIDWTESALVGLYFALQCREPVVWMLDPFALNQASTTDGTSKQAFTPTGYPLTWFDPRGPVRNIGSANINAAWEEESGALELPVAVHPTYLHRRMSSQRSVFTVHGSKKEPLSDLVPEQILRRFTIAKDAISPMLSDLHMLGIHHSTAFPDLDGLANELSALY